MDDLISRQAAIDAILAVTGNSSVRELYEHVQEHGLSDMWSGGVNAAIDIIIAVPPAQQWIPCSERLPTTKDDYIITVKDKSLTWTDYVEWSADYHWWWYDDDMVIAWMPLPEPYKGEES